MKFPKSGITRIIVVFALAGIIWAVVFMALSLAMDADLWQLPRLPGSTVVWVDQPMEVNQIKANATHLRTNMSAEEVVSFYKEALIAQGWRYDSNVTPEIASYVKGKNFIYVGVFPAKSNQPRDVYIISSPMSLAICQNLKDYFLKDKISPDVEGKDVDGVPRYPGSMRRMDIVFPRQSGVWIYEAQAHPAEIANYFRQQMKQAGWKEEKALSAAVVKKVNPLLKDIQLLMFYRGDSRLLFNITTTPKNFPGKDNAQNRSLIIITKNMEKEIAFPKQERGKPFEQAPNSLEEGK